MSVVPIARRGILSCVVRLILLLFSQSLFFALQKLIDLLNQFHQLVGVLLDSCLFTESAPAFASFALHKDEPLVTGIYHNWRGFGTGLHASDA